MKALLVSVAVLAFAGLAGAEPKALAESPKAESSDVDLAKCSLKRAQCRTSVDMCLKAGEELTCKQAQYICERVDPRCPQ